MKITDTTDRAVSDALGAQDRVLPKVPMPSYGGISSHDRPSVAFSALRIVTTGIDREIW
ncbi:hypothetical protein [Nonomuraea roseola]|uniref:Uncharacterized protein n=1 Tax=Nonomuraea roseola TaxID=46179 RepID=A0ABV5QFU2_9ACTN